MPGTNALMSAPGVEHAEKMRSDGNVFRIMTIGEQGLGKSTMVSCLLHVPQDEANRFLEVFNDSSTKWEPVDELPGGDSTKTIRKYRHILVDPATGAKSIYEIIDTPGFASQINNANSWISKKRVILEAFREFNALKIAKPTDESDAKVHLCIYVLPPLNRPLRELDKRVMLDLQQWVPVLPVIAKADSFLEAPLDEHQKKLREEFEEVGIVPLTSRRLKSRSDEEGEETIHWSSGTVADAPYSIIASSDTYRKITGDDQKEFWEQCQPHDEGAVFGRKYRWGLAQCDEHSELTDLRNLIIHKRFFIKKLCNEHFEHWKALRDATIKDMARALAQKKNQTMCGRRASADHAPSDEDKANAERQWEKDFANMFESKAVLKSEDKFHAVQQEDAEESIPGEERLQTVFLDSANLQCRHSEDRTMWMHMASGMIMSSMQPLVKDFAKEMWRQAVRWAVTAAKNKLVGAICVAGA